jgi:hypothetical protein
MNDLSQNARKGNMKARGRFAIIDGENTRTILLVGRLAETMAALVQAGERGLTERDAGEFCWRLSEYIAQLRNRYGVPIATVEVVHRGGWHARYVLEFSVTVLSFQPAQYGA